MKKICTALAADPPKLEQWLAEALGRETGLAPPVLFRRGSEIAPNEMDAVLFAGEEVKFLEKHKHFILRLAAGGCRVICIGPEARDWMAGVPDCEFVALPKQGGERAMERFRRELSIRVKSAYGRSENAARQTPGRRASRRLAGIGASTGGPPVLLSILQGLSTGTCGVLVVQHLSTGFSTRFAEYLDALCPGRVKQAEDGELIEDGVVYLAENGRHMTVVKRPDGFHVRSRPGDKINGFCPSVDRLFETLAEQAGPDAMGVILTGMGNDGAKGLYRMRAAGGDTVVQDEASCAVYSMPSEAVRQGGAAGQMPPQQICDRILRFSAQVQRRDKGEG